MGKTGRFPWQWGIGALWGMRSLECCCLRSWGLTSFQRRPIWECAGNSGKAGGSRGEGYHSSCSSSSSPSPGPSCWDSWRHPSEQGSCKEDYLSFPFSHIVSILFVGVSLGWPPVPSSRLHSQRL